MVFFLGESTKKTGLLGLPDSICLTRLVVLLLSHCGAIDAWTWQSYVSPWPSLACSDDVFVSEFRRLGLAFLDDCQRHGGLGALGGLGGLGGSVWMLFWALGRVENEDA